MPKSIEPPGITYFRRFRMYSGLPYCSWSKLAPTEQNAWNQVAKLAAQSVEFALFPKGKREHPKHD